MSIVTTDINNDDGIANSIPRIVILSKIDNEFVDDDDGDDSYSSCVSLDNFVFPDFRSNAGDRISQHRPSLHSLPAYLLEEWVSKPISRCRLHLEKKNKI
jgi:hypothetical protein